MRNEAAIMRMFRRAVKHPLLRKKIKNRPVGLFLLPDGKMRAMKKKFLPREKGPANVLAFSEPKHWPHAESKMPPLGEIYLNKKFATEKMASLLIVHGVLHLLGYD